MRRVVLPTSADLFLVFFPYLVRQHTYKRLGRDSEFLLLERNTIIEAMGLNANSCRKRNKRKTKDYLHHNYEVIAVVPNEKLY
nr:hypothetical protein [Candidatus Njordarchaeota archaeon]